MASNAKVRKPLFYQRRHNRGAKQMTQAELFDQWARYMHRADLSGDMPEVYEYAVNKTLGRMMNADIEIAEIMDEQPQIMLQAGLCYLNELAQDDVSLDRSERFFEGSALDYQMRRSIKETAAPAAQIGA